MDTNTAAQLLVQARRKSGWVAALLNVVLPGAGYAYCGRWFLGIVAFVFCVALIVMSFGIVVPVLDLILFIDGFLAAGRYNRRLIENLVLSGGADRPAAPVVAASTLNVTVNHQASTTGARQERECPHCAERILEKASRCRFCNQVVTPIEIAEDVVAPPYPAGLADRPYVFPPETPAQSVGTSQPAQRSEALLLLAVRVLAIAAVAVAVAAGLWYWRGVKPMSMGEASVEASAVPAKLAPHTAVPTPQAESAPPAAAAPAVKLELTDLVRTLATLATVPADETYTARSWDQIRELLPSLQWASVEDKEFPFAQRVFVPAGVNPSADDSMKPGWTISAAGARTMISRTRVTHYDATGNSPLADTFESALPVTVVRCEPDERASDWTRWYRVSPAGSKPLVAELLSSSGSAGITQGLTFWIDETRLPPVGSDVNGRTWTDKCK